ncbi:hypothetical protein H0H81_010001 [Sphagnurus paluster]|uniref:FAD-binding PCMH-type domain-containing protein n=1 Tax=Sphagnurus paluster TaxID=117069 RepID=A0A9P7GJB6_9AGAR|nr:hypothetical protein H0H81_010001 [Sphagnurus paluster]
MPDFEKFKTRFKGDIVTPDDADYRKALARWAVNAERRAKIVAFVKDAEDVALAIKYARLNSLPIAIRGGGHSPAGASSSEDGLVIDLSRHIKGARIDPDKKLAYVGGGALWDIVDKEAIKHGLATVAGTVNHTGVGGLILGGGFGWLTAKYGLAIDNLVQATLVTADGSVVTASDTENPDLFFAIRGGGSNFGVVTEFVLRLHPQRAKVYHGTLVFPPTVLEKMVEVTAKWWANVGENEGMLQMFGLGPDGNPAIILFIFYNGSEEEGRANYKSFFDLGPVVDFTKEIPYENVNAALNEGMAHGKGVYQKGFANNHYEYQSIVQAYEKIISVSSPEFKVNLIFEYFPIGKVISVPLSATAFRRDPAPLAVLLILWTKDAEGTTERARTIAYDLARIVSGAELTEVQNFGYSNYDPEAVSVTGHRAQIAYGENYPRLQAIKKRYDPDNIFNKWFAITPA